MSSVTRDPTDPLGRFAALSEPDRQAMARVPNTLVVDYWRSRLAAEAAALTDDELRMALQTATRARDHGDERPLGTAARVRALGWIEALQAEQRRRGQASG